jgi:Zn finger protein HypA/HybF involved in hydrogenase expression
MEAGTTSAVTQREYPCQSCGAKLQFAPGTQALTCPYCNAQQDIAAAAEPVSERSFDQALAQLAMQPASTLAAGGHEIQCKGCGAITLLTGHASACPFCDSPLVVPVEQDRDTIVPDSLMPFKIDARTAMEAFKTWLGKLWFAPNDLSERAQRASLDGVYLPYYTFDSSTHTVYQGQRGEHYYETEWYTDNEGNRQSRQVQKTRWYSASGTVHVEFDDTLVQASRSLPTKLLDGLEPWNLAELRRFEPAYLSGFMAERAVVDLREGFGVAKHKNEDRIDQEIRSDIGGDVQRITWKSTEYSNVTFKLFLLPVWLSSFRYGERVFRVVVNAQNGEISGERPWSAIKIALAVAAVIVLIVGIYVILTLTD